MLLDTDEEYKAKHPAKYALLVCIGILGFILPMIFVLLLTLLWLPLPENTSSIFLLLVIPGCLIMGIGFFNIVGAWLNQYLGHAVTFGSFLIGGTFMALGLVPMYVPDINGWFSLPQVSQYFSNLGYLCFPALPYFFFRLGVGDWIKRRKIRRREVERLKKGKRNYWWYEALHETYNLGAIYYLNKAATVSYALTVLLALFSGWQPHGALAAACLHGLLSLLLVVMQAFATVQSNLEEYGKAFVLFRRREYGRPDTILVDLLSIVLPILLSYRHIESALKFFL